MDRRAALIFAGLGVAWGIPYVLIKIAVEELTPAQLVLGRTALAAILLLPLALARGVVRPVLRRWRPVLVYSLVEITISWVFLSHAEQHLPSSTTGLLIAAVPLVGLGLALLTRRAERLSMINLAGLMIGLLGVGALVGFDVGGGDAGSLAQLAATVVGYALGPAIMARWLSDLPGLGVVAVSLSMASITVIPVVLLTDGFPTRVPAGRVIGSVIALAVICTGLAFLLLFALVNAIGPVRATTITYVNPLIAVLAGAWILQEQITVWTAVGFALVITGSVLVNRRAPGSPPSAAQDVLAEAAAESEPGAESVPGAESGADRAQTLPAAAPRSAC